jgi:outer membrane lipoprotein-sorting protein
MDRRRATLGAAAVGVVAGVVGLGFLAAPAGAGPAPNLPSTTPAALVQSVLTASPPAMSGTVQVDNNLGLPSIPGLPDLASGSGQIRVWTDGADHSRISIPSSGGEQTVVDDGSTVYEWDSADRSVTEHKVGAEGAKPAGPSGRHMSSESVDPATAAKELVSAVQQSSTVTVDGTDLVANRPAYDLVLTPKPSERTLLREVRIAVDSQTRMPLQLTVLADNTDTPALQIGFSSVDFGKQDASLFHFSVPAGATVVDGDKQAQRSMPPQAGSITPKLVGSGWDTVVTADVSQLLGTKQDSAVDPMKLVRTFGTPVHGSWGSGYVISIDVGTALITNDGRVAAGFVPQQVLISALGSGK